MSIRLKLFFSYVLFFLLILANVLLIELSGRRLERIESKILTIHDAREEWSALLVSLNEMMINWDDGETYMALRRHEAALDRLLGSMGPVRSAEGGSFRFVTGPSDRTGALQNVWSIVGYGLEAIHEDVRSQPFVSMTVLIRREPGLQRLSRLWSDYLSSPEPPSSDLSRGIVAIRDVMDQIEFFPLYTETINHLLDVMVEEATEYASGIKTLRDRLNFVVLVLFLCSYYFFARFFSHQLSAPIIAISRDLSGFIGRELKVPHVGTGDEIRILESSVDNLKKHYTSLSERAGRLAKGDLNATVPSLPYQGIVGRSLNELANYLKELAQTSGWIRSGQYGAVVEPKSEQDILANNFNVMSRVIEDKISTLKNIFEIIGEGILVIEDTGRVIEANKRFSRLYSSGLDEIRIPGATEEIFEGYQRSIISLTENEDEIKDHYTELLTAKGHRIPVRVTARQLPSIDGRCRRFMYSFSDESWRTRLRRERKKLLSHAMEAELRALRAQINPHFLFNTLNMIADLVESDADEALTTIEELSGLFRYTLVSTRKELVGLDEEIDFTKSYLAIEQRRFGSLLQYSFNIDVDCLGHQIAPMLIQPVVENAVKYGHGQDGGIVLFIDIRSVDNGYRISIGDRGVQEIDLDALLLGRGTGLQNVNQRLKTLYNRGLGFVRNSPSGLIVKMTIPVGGVR